jgi:hypothetical protein
LKWYAVNRLNINVRKTVFMMFGRQRALVDSLKIGDNVVPRSCRAVYLGLRLDANLQWTYHINYVISRIRHVRLILSRFSGMFDRSMRIYLSKVLIFPVISLYDFIYGATSTKYLVRLNTAYNQLMRTVLGIRRSEHVRIDDMYKMCGFEPLATRRRASLLKFMDDVKCERLFSNIRARVAKVSHAYSMRSHGAYVIPNSRTTLGQQRISVRGLALLNSST